MTAEIIFGTETGEVCNRNGCKGVIEEHIKEGACSCHLNPPCSYCVDDNHYCPECNWDGQEEQRKPVTISDSQAAMWAKEQENWEIQRNNFYKKYNSTEPVLKYESRTRAHTHFTQIVEGMYTDDMTRDEVRERVRGTFGGRFTRFSNGRFAYIAYTD